MEIARSAYYDEPKGSADDTALVEASYDQGLAVCDRLNRRLGHLDRESWIAFAVRCLRVGVGAMNGSTLH